MPNRRHFSRLKTAKIQLGRPQCRVLHRTGYDRALLTLLLYLLRPLLLLLITLERLELLPMQLFAMLELLVQFVSKAVQVRQRRCRLAAVLRRLLRLLLHQNPLLQLALCVAQLVHELLLPRELLPHVVVLAHEDLRVDPWHSEAVSCLVLVRWILHQLSWIS